MTNNNIKILLLIPALASMMVMSSFVPFVYADIANPIVAASVTDGVNGFDELDGARAVDIVTIGSNVYAVVVSYSDDGVQIIDITTPGSPTATASVTDGVNGFDELDGAYGVDTVTIGSNVYAVVASNLDDGVQIIDITTPGSPTATASITDGVGGFDTLDGAISVDIVTIGSNVYAVVASPSDDGVQIIDITTPGSPTATASVTDGVNGFDELDGAFGVDTVTIGSNVYAVVASGEDDGVQIIDITTPGSPTAIASVTDGVNGFDELNRARGVDTVTIGSNVYAVVASSNDDGVQIIDITTPGSPTATASVTDGVNGFDELDGTYVVDTVTIGSNVYAVVASVLDDGVQIIDITTPGSPTATASVTDGVNGFDELDGAFGVDTVTIGSNVYAVVASLEDDGVQIIDLGTILTSSTNTTGNVYIQQTDTCGIGLGTGAPISYGSVAPSATSTEQTLVIQNTGNTNATTFVSGTDWIDSTDSTIITIDNTRYSSSSGDYSTKTSLTTDDSSFMVIQPSINTDTFWQLQATLSDSTFSGDLTQTVNFAATC